MLNVLRLPLAQIGSPLLIQVIIKKHSFLTRLLAVRIPFLPNTFHVNMRVGIISRGQRTGKDLINITIFK